ncbi:uncharacterized protein LOC130449117 [Diorhabda sublineata]|uniref:uncharacterized protein LOC130449117 n=1 Tax=Diorhabda sublineata TaxID=1163346 RepID=UPI0024E13FFD|nr:uncharacterized protein LOC130449117 [Diorhabda sublineata]
MEAKSNVVIVPWLPAVLFVITLYPMEVTSAATLIVTRHNNGDIFTQMTGPDTKCMPDTCVGISSGTATALSDQDMCTCRCHPHLPAFREDLHICVDDIHECLLAPFVGGSTSQQIPFVYLPLKGQVIYPGKEISFNGVRSSICAVSGAKYMSSDGWVDLRNPVGSDIPFKLQKDNGRTFLQWSGNGELRNKLSGKLIIVNLVCRETELESTDFPRIQMLFSPCVAFRVVGSSSNQLASNVSEVAFVIDQNATKENATSDTLSVSEYVAIGICSILLGLIYVASVFLYLHIRKKKTNNSRDNRRDSRCTRDIEEGIVKSNPLLSIPTHFLPGDAAYSDTNSSDNENTPDVINQHEERKKHASVVIHAQKSYNSRRRSQFCSFDNYHQDSNTNEKLPEENVSIIETLEGREEKPENIKSLTSSTRKKLYFNPAYFEPHLLLEPPPGAIDFLSKIREVISIAKQKLESKRFQPSLMNIPEEEDNPYPMETLYGLNAPSISRRSSTVSLKRENSRRKTCTGCPGCEPQDFNSVNGKLPEFPSLAACRNCTSNTNESKQRIRKWLEDVPIIKVPNDVALNSIDNCQKKIRLPTKTLPASSEKQNKKLPPINRNKNEEDVYCTVPVLPSSDMVKNCTEFDRREEKIATLTKEQMNAVIYEFTKHKNLLENKEEEEQTVEYETDSLERTPRKGFSTPSEYAEVSSSSQPSPSLSSVLPDHEELTMRNAIINKRTGNMTISKINMEALQEDEHDYELIVMKKGCSVNTESCKLAELLQKNKGYSLVSEVYVNNGYNYGSAPSTPSNSRYSTLDTKQLKVKYEGTAEKPGKLLIEVEDCLDNYIRVNDSDEFEQDTLDRKSNGNSIRRSQSQSNNYEDSLERPSHILLTTNGSFRNRDEVVDSIEEPLDSGNFNRLFGSLREIYEAKTRNGSSRKDEGYAYISDEEKGRILTLEERHCRRQRSKVQPDLIPPPIYDRIDSTQKISNCLDNGEENNPFRSKIDHIRSAGNGSGGGASDSRTDEYKLCLLQKSKRNGNITNLIQTEDFILKKGCNDQFIFHSVVSPRRPFHHSKDKLTWQNTLKPEDSGYLSSDSNESRLNNVKLTVLEPIGSETDESCLEDARSESGAESVETHSVFFGRFDRNAGVSCYGSMDSGVIGGEEGISSSDSETVSYATVIPVTSDPF